MVWFCTNIPALVEPVMQAKKRIVPDFAKTAPCERKTPISDCNGKILNNAVPACIDFNIFLFIQYSVGFIRGQYSWLYPQSELLLVKFFFLSVFMIKETCEYIISVS